jgi:hypothetical protein
MSKGSTFFVIPGTWDEYEKFKNDCYTNGRYFGSKFVYIPPGGVNILRGWENPNGAFIGTWWGRQDINDIILTLVAAIRKDDYPKKAEGIRAAIEFLRTKKQKPDDWFV